MQWMPYCERWGPTPRLLLSPHWGNCSRESNQPSLELRGALVSANKELLLVSILSLRDTNMLRLEQLLPRRPLLPQAS